MTIFYCFRFEDLPTWSATFPYLYHPGIGWPSYTPRHWVPFSSPPTTHRAKVEVLDPVSTREADEQAPNLASLTNPRSGPRRKHSSSPIVVQLLHYWVSTASQRERVYRAVTQKRPLYISPPRGRYMSTVKQATISYCSIPGWGSMDPPGTITTYKCAERALLCLSGCVAAV
jgi:hypothetical protein